MEGLISVIVPVYKVEKYLPKCVNSILNQTYKNIEIILVDDGSPDGCPEICDQYAKQYNHVKVIHQANQGLSAARNSGIDQARGAFIAFVDSDDIIHEKMYEILYNNLTKNNADMAICKLKYTYESEAINCKSSIQQENISVYNGREALSNLYQKDSINTVVAWNKLYKRKLFDKQRFKVGKTHEDEFLIHRMIDLSNKVVYTDAPLYYYLQRDTSIMGTEFNLKRLDHVEAIKDRMEYFKERGYDDLYEKACDHYLETIITHYLSVRKYYPDEKKIAAGLKDIFFETYENNRVDRFPFKNRLKYYLFHLHPSIYQTANILLGSQAKTRIKRQGFITTYKQ